MPTSLCLLYSVQGECMHILEGRVLFYAIIQLASLLFAVLLSCIHLIMLGLIDIDRPPIADETYLLYLARLLIELPPVI